MILDLQQFENSPGGHAIYICGENLAEAWEKSIVQLYHRGKHMPTQYDKPGDPPSITANIMIEVINPLAEPRIHRCFPGGITDLEAYRQEVVDGIHDHWVNPAEGKWEYTYHQRLFDYDVPEYSPTGFVVEDDGWRHINQIQYCIDAIKECPHTRRAIAVTWKPWEDAGIHDPACLQNVWFSVIDGKLDMVAQMRSNDAFKAAFMNMYSFTDLQRYVAEQTGFEVGTYTHLANSYHIYGAYMKEIEGFFKTLANRTFEERTYRTDDPLIIELISEAREQIIESIRREKETGLKGL
jgi:thymidylate synthase